MWRALGLACLLTLVPTLIHAEASTYRCTFGEGITAEWESGRLKTKRSSLSEDPAGLLIFDQIDPREGTARGLGNSGAVDLAVLKSPESLSFLEITPSGNVVLTSIFTGMQSDDGSVPAVVSRHIRLAQDVALPQQYYGTCIAQ
jgi:hypothetical protein